MGILRLNPARWVQSFPLMFDLIECGIGVNLTEPPHRGFKSRGEARGLGVCQVFIRHVHAKQCIRASLVCKYGLSSQDILIHSGGVP